MIKCETLKMISIIVPVYNTEAFVKECIESILNQTYQEFELILVDDGSKDKSFAICQEMARKDKRIKIFHQENLGVTAARKKGVENAQGEFICFVDSDDIMADYALEFLISKMTSDIDIVISEANVNESMAHEIYVDKLLRNLFSHTLWGKLFRKELFAKSEALNFRREINIGEDFLGNVCLGLAANHVACLTGKIYHYQKNPNSAMTTFQYSPEYDRIFRAEMEKVLGDEIFKYMGGWCKFQFSILESMIIGKAKFSYDESWIQTLIHNNMQYNPVSIKEWMLMKCRIPLLCRYILLWGYKTKNILTGINFNCIC